MKIPLNDLLTMIIRVKEEKPSTKTIEILFSERPTSDKEPIQTKLSFKFDERLQDWVLQNEL